ncbi:MAG: ABC transporter ATP-binding protein [Rhodoferax sp.]
MSALLRAQGLTLAYGTSQVLFGLDLSLPQGAVSTLMGRNGMGKTSTVRALMGLQPLRDGQIWFRGERIDGLPPERIARMGLALVPEGRQIFPNLSVRENLVAFAANRCASPTPWDLDAVLALFPRLGERLRHAGNQLSGGEQQMLAVGRALMTNPHLLILDEATEGLAPQVRQDIWRCLHLLRSRGQAILVIDKHVQPLLALAQHHTVIERGRVVWSGASDALAAQPEIWQRHVGV